MNYDGTLVMPCNYVVMDNNEMEYLDGGGELWIEIGKNSFIIHALSAVGGTLTISAAKSILASLGIAIATRDSRNGNIICRCIFACLGKYHTTISRSSSNIWSSESQREKI
jgi:hypothetical protein